MWGGGRETLVLSVELSSSASGVHEEESSGSGAVADGRR